MNIRHPQSVEELKEMYDFVAKILDLKNDHIRNLDFYKNVFYQYPEYLIYTEEDTKLSGVLLATPQDENSLLIGELAVSDESRGSGIGSLLLDKIEKVALGNGKKSILLGARDIAEKFYLKHKYKPLLFIQLEGGNRLKELEKFVKQYAPGYEITWKSKDNTFSKIIIDTKTIDKTLQGKANKLNKSHTQYLFSKNLK